VPPEWAMITAGAALWTNAIATAVEMEIGRFLHQGVKCLGGIFCVHCYDLQFGKKISPVIVLLCAVQ